MSKLERINAELKKQLSIILAGEFADPRITGMLSVHSVEVDSDLTLAKVYVSIMNSSDKAASLAALNGAQGFIKSELKNKIKLRALPELRFLPDESVDYGMKIEKILQGLKHND